VTPSNHCTRWVGGVTSDQGQILESEAMGKSLFWPEFLQKGYRKKARSTSKRFASGVASVISRSAENAALILVQMQKTLLVTAI
jgi:hypothetical protein